MHKRFLRTSIDVKNIWSNWHRILCYRNSIDKLYIDCRTSIDVQGIDCRTSIEIRIYFVEPEWCEVITEVLISLMSKSSHLLRTVSTSVFTKILPMCNTASIQLILDVSIVTCSFTCLYLLLYIDK